MDSRSSLATLLQHPALWRGDDCAPEPAALTTGFPALDAELPGRGWPAAALTEMLPVQEGIGEITLTLPALAGLQAGRHEIVWIAPPHVPYAPALANAGLDLGRLLIVRCRTAAEQLWAFEQALRAPECGAAFAWLATPDPRVLRRLQVAAREGRTWGVVWRRPGQCAQATPVALRLGLARAQDRLAVRILKRRGAELARPILLDVKPARLRDDARCHDVTGSGRISGVTAATSRDQVGFPGSGRRNAFAVRKSDLAP